MEGDSLLMRTNSPRHLLAATAHALALALALALTALALATVSTPTTLTPTLSATAISATALTTAALATTLTKLCSTHMQVARRRCDEAAQAHVRPFSIRVSASIRVAVVSASALPSQLLG